MTRGKLWVGVVALACCGASAPPQQRLMPGLKLTTKSIDLPEDRENLPASPGNDLITQNCTGCHSAEMLTTQPRLDAKSWAAEIAKMRNVYHAPIEPADDAALVAALGALPAQTGSMPAR